MTRRSGTAGPSPAITLSVVINNYNYARHLRACLDSVLAQSATDTEIIVVDDGSTDDSLDLLRSFGPRIRLIAQKNAGQAAAINAGIAAARGELMLLLDADDVFHPSKLAAIRAAFARLPRDRPLCLTHRFAWIDRHGGPIRRRRAALRAFAARCRHPMRLHRVMSPARAVRLTRRYGDLAWPCETRTSLLCLNRAMAERLFPLPAETARICADEFIVRGAQYSGDFYCLENVLTAYRDHGANGWLHSRTPARDRAYKTPLRAYLTERYRAAGGTGSVEPDDAVVTHIYVREGLSIRERWEAARRCGPSDLAAFCYVAALMLRRMPHWLTTRRERTERGTT